jgi:small subunit ribosomal protein S5
MDTVQNTNQTSQTAPATPGAKPFVKTFGAKPRFFGNRGPARPFLSKDGQKSFSGKPSFGQSDRTKNPRKSPFSRGERVKPEFEQKILNIRRVTRVTSGGKRLNFSVVVVAGNKKGSVGVGMGKANDTSLAIEKAFRDAKKNMLHLSLTKTMSIPFEVSAKYCSGNIKIMPASGRGVTAGSALRDVIELAGIKDVTTKILSRSKNKLNIAMATIEALSLFKNKNKVAVKPVESTDNKVIKEIVK